MTLIYSQSEHSIIDGFPFTFYRTKVEMSLNPDQSDFYPRFVESKVFDNKEDRDKYLGTFNL